MFHHLREARDFRVRATLGMHASLLLRALSELLELVGEAGARPQNCGEDVRLIVS